MGDQVKFNEFDEESSIVEHTKTIKNVTDETCINNFYSSIMEENNKYGETSSDSTKDHSAVQKNEEGAIQFYSLEDLTEKNKFVEASSSNEQTVEDGTDETNDAGNTDDLDYIIMKENNEYDETFPTITTDESIDEPINKQDYNTDETCLNDSSSTDDLDSTLTQENNEYDGTSSPDSTDDLTKIQKTDEAVTQLKKLVALMEKNKFGEASTIDEHTNSVEDATVEICLNTLGNTEDLDSTLVEENTEYEETSAIITLVKNTEDVTQLNTVEDQTKKYEFIEAPTIDDAKYIKDATDEICLNTSGNTEDFDSTHVEENTEYEETSAIITLVKNTEDVTQLNTVEDQTKKYEFIEASTIDDAKYIKDAMEETCLDDSANIDDLDSTLIQENDEHVEISFIDPTENLTVVQKNEEDVTKLNNTEKQNDEIDDAVKPELANSGYHQKTENIAQINEPKQSSSELRKHVFRDPSTYKEFVPRISIPLEEDTFSIRSGGSSSTSSLYGLPKEYDPKQGIQTFQAESRSFTQVPRHYNHSFVATIDAFLLVLEGTLAGLYRISKNHRGPPIPPLVANTMQSVRLSLETLRVHFGYTPQENFEPVASILRDLLTPAVDLFAQICPELSFPDNLDFYSPLLVPISPSTVPVVPKQKSKPEYLVTPSEINGTTIYHRHPVPSPHTAPRIPLFMNMSQDPNLGIFATADGMLRVNLPFTFQIDITLDGAILMRNFRDRTFAAISTCGSQSGIHTDLCRVYQHGKITEIHITDEIAGKNMYAKIGVRGIRFGGTSTPANLHLKENGNMIVADYSFRNLEHDYIKEIFLDYTNTYGPNFYEACSAALQECRSKTLVDGSLHFYWRDITITQFRNGELIITRNNRDFLIWCSPEIIHPYTGTEKKGMIRVVTPISRINSTVMSTPVKQNEKFFLTNLDRNWVYYTARAFVISNEVHSAGYGLTLKEITDLQAESNISI